MTFSNLHKLWCRREELKKSLFANVAILISILTNQYLSITACLHFKMLRCLKIKFHSRQYPRQVNKY